MKIIVYKYKESGNVRRVDLRSRFESKTDEEIEEAISKFNSSDTEQEVALIEVPDELSEVIRFLIGDKAYKRSFKIEDIVDSLGSLKENFNEAQESLDYIEERLRRIRSEIASLKEE